MLFDIAGIFFNASLARTRTWIGTLATVVMICDNASRSCFWSEASWDASGTDEGACATFETRVRPPRRRSIAPHWPPRPRLMSDERVRRAHGGEGARGGGSPPYW